MVRCPLLPTHLAGLTMMISSNYKGEAGPSREVAKVKEISYQNGLPSLAELRLVIIEMAGLSGHDPDFVDPFLQFVIKNI